MQRSENDIELIVNNSVADITTAILLHSEDIVIRELISNCDSETKKILIEAITQLTGEAAYQGIAAGMNIYREVLNNKSKLSLVVN